MAQLCGGTTRAGSACRRPAGWGTAHVGDGKCKLHGGASTGPRDQRGNKNAVTTGEYETIWLDQLTGDERDLYPRINPDALVQLEEEIRLTTIRERRMLSRIATLGAFDYTIVEKRTEHKVGVDAGDSDEDDTGSVDVTLTKIVELGTLGQIQDIEHALTRVQQAKTRLIELRHRLHAGDGDDDALADLVAVIARSRQEAERRRQATDDGTE